MWQWEAAKMLYAFYDYLGFKAGTTFVRKVCTRSAALGQCTH